MFKYSKNHRQKADITIAAVLDTSWQYIAKAAPVSLPPLQVNETTAPTTITAQSPPQGVTPTIEKDRPTKVVSTKVDVDPQAGKIDIPLPKEAGWTKVVR